jgi:diadenosine tetraphosphate (Ap4A) HIT family hydrolase
LVNRVARACCQRRSGGHRRPAIHHGRACGLLVSVTIADGCFSCESNARINELTPRERIVVDDYWRVAHAVGTALPGWLVLLPRRHVLTIAELTDPEAAGLGIWQVRLSRALHAVTGCVKTYVVQFAEAPRFSHVHFHLIPRMPDLPADRRGPKVFEFLTQPAEQAITDRQMDNLAVELTQYLQRQRGT